MCYLTRDLSDNLSPESIKSAVILPRIITLYESLLYKKDERNSIRLLNGWKKLYNAQVCYLTSDLSDNTNISTINRSNRIKNLTAFYRTYIKKLNEIQYDYQTDENAYPFNYPINDRWQSTDWIIKRSAFFQPHPQKPN